MYHFPLFFQGIQTVPVFLHVFMWYLELFLFWGHTLSCLVRECFTFLYSMLFINDLCDRSTCTLKKKVKAVIILNFDLALNDNINEWMKTQTFFFLIEQGFSSTCLRMVGSTTSSRTCTMRSLQSVWTSSSFPTNPKSTLLVRTAKNHASQLKDMLMQCTCIKTIESKWLR